MRQQKRTSRRYAARLSQMGRSAAAEVLEQRCLLTAVVVNAEARNDWLVVLDESADAAAALNALQVDIEATLGRSVDVLHGYEHVFSGMAAQLTDAEAGLLQTIPEVAFVEKSISLQPQSLFGREWIQSSQIWQGTATDGIPGTQGEGVVIGIIDSGIDPRSLSFAEVGPVDGYSHVNPLGIDNDGDENFLGICDEDAASFDPAALCNSKLIGIYNFSSDSFNDAEDADHGTHVAATAAGNLVDVTLDGLAEPVRIAGVAPHANIISYDACIEAGCATTDTIAAIEQAIVDGVDVINMSLGGYPGGISQLLTLALRSARESGIYVAVSAMNEGPDPSTVGIPASAPWLTAVANTSHNGLIAKTMDVVSPEPIAPELTGISFLEGDAVAVNADIGPVGIHDAATIDPDNAEGCSPFPAGSFENAVAFIDRGTCFYDDKVTNAQNAGAVAIVVANHSPGPPHTNAFLETGTLPTAAIQRNDGIQLRNWIAANPTGEIMLNSSAAAVTEDSLADIVRLDSSRGPNTFFDILTPAIAAPGTEVLAPTASATGDPEWSFFSGTSMASPHVAGAAALIKSLQPTWTPAEIQSAFMLTAVPFDQLTKDDGVTPADPHDVGSGRIDLSKAALTGFVLYETTAAFNNLTTRAQSRDLNLPAFVHSELTESVTWTRTIRSTVDHTVTWTPTFSGPPEFVVTVNPAVVHLAPGAVQEIIVTGSFRAPPENPSEWNYGSLTLTPDNLSIPNAQMPLAVQWQSNTVGVTVSQASVVEGAAPLTAQVFRTSDSTTALTVNLTSSHDSRIHYPDSILIPAGQMESAEFEIQIIDNTVQADSVVVTLTAAATGHSTGSAALNVIDDEGVDLRATEFDVVSDHVRTGIADIVFGIRNDGHQAVGAFEVNVVWSPDDVLGDANDIVVATHGIAALAKGETIVQSHSTPLDKAALHAHAVAQTAAGSPVGTISEETSHVFLVIDPLDTIPEFNEVNNSSQGHLIDHDDITYFPWDTNGTGVVTPINALNAIRAVNTDDADFDLDGNGVVTPLEALGALQRIGVERNGAVFDAISSTTELSGPLDQISTFDNGHPSISAWEIPAVQQAALFEPSSVMRDNRNADRKPDLQQTDTIFADHVAWLDVVSPISMSRIDAGGRVTA